MKFSCCPATVNGIFFSDVTGNIMPGKAGEKSGSLSGQNHEPGDLPVIAVCGHGAWLADRRKGDTVTILFKANHLEYVRSFFEHIPGEALQRLSF